MTQDLVVCTMCTEISYVSLDTDVCPKCEISGYLLDLLQEVER